MLNQLAGIWPVAAVERCDDAAQVARWDEAFQVAAAGNAEMAKVHRDVTECIRIIRRLDFTKLARIEATYEDTARY